MKYIDLFSGTGAFSYCLDKMGFECVLSNDIDKNSETIYNLNFNNNFVLENIHNLENIPKCDILCGGFPCQPFSIAGKKLGFKDDRSNVFWKILEIIKSSEPSVIILENVKNLKMHDNGNTLKVIIENLENLGYHIRYEILNTKNITKIPQNRERIYIIGSKDKNNFNLDFEKIQNDSFKNFLENNIPDKYYYTPKSKIYDKLTESVNDENTIYQFRRHYVRENKSNSCPTLTANMGMGGHNVPIIKDAKGIRKLTPRECFNLQGFPKDYKLPDLSDSALYKLAGNAITVPVVELLFSRIFPNL